MRAPNDHKSPAATSAFAAGFVFLTVTSVGWGLNWPVMKHLLTELPPLSARGWSALVGAVSLAALALARRETMRVPRALWPRLVLISLLTVGTWASLIAVSLLWLRAGEAAVIAASMPVWVSLLALLILHEHFSLLRALALAIALTGLAILFGADGFEASVDKLPGALLAITATLCVALGTVLTKRFPFQLPAISLAAWQIGIGCVPILLAGLWFERANFAGLSMHGWLLMAYMTFVQFCVCYACWFAALARLPASTASIGSLLIPVVGVLASAATLGEPLGLREVLALGLTLGGVMLAARS
jgi:drug/metabolite transporter (DMT)-like permease